MTPLIDIIFLLLLFFMLTSTFTRFAEIPLAQGGSGTAAPDTTDVQRIFLRLGPGGMRINGELVSVAGVGPFLTMRMEGKEAEALLSLGPDVPSEQFVRTLARLQTIPNLSVTVLR